MTAPTLPQTAPATAPKLWPHQADAIQFALGRTGAGFDHGMGGGKSRSAVEVLDRLHATRVLVLCPKSVTGVWPRELAKHSPREWLTWAGRVHGARGVLANPSVERRATALLNANKDAIKLHRPFLACVNFEAAWQGAMGQLLLGTKWDVVILDESHRLKSGTGKASTFAAKLCARVRQNDGITLALTGTLLPHSFTDAWAQARALDGGATFGTSYVQFCRRYGKPNTVYAPGGRELTKYDELLPERADEFTRKLAGLFHRVAQEDLDAMLGLPEIVDTYRTVELRPGTRKVYDQLEKDLVADLDSGDGPDRFVEAANAMVLTTRLAQLSGGFTKTSDGELAQIADPPEKAELLADVLADLPKHEPVVVFCRFHPDLDAVRRVAEKTGRSYGEMSGRRRDGLTEQSEMAAVDVLGCQLQSGGVGIDLTRARYGIWYSLDFNLANWLQSRKRLHRPGQTRRTTFIHVLAEDTIDRAVYGALHRREAVIDAVLSRITTNQGAPLR